MILWKRQLLLGLVCCCFLLACKKTERNIVHENYEVSGLNEIPPYNGITRLQTSNYVNKLNIDLLGVEPTQEQLEEDVDFLINNGLDQKARTTIIEQLMTAPAYFDRLFQLASIQLLNGMDRTQIEAIRTEQEFVRDFLNSNGDSLTGKIVEQEIVKLTQLLTAQTDYQNGSLTINGFFKRFIYNLVYDEINMGSENFAISCFENLLKRYPTTIELERAVKMIDGQPNHVLLVGGNSKLDFVDIIVGSSDFHAGQLIDIYQQMLLRKPSSDELSEATVRFVKAGDYENELLTLMVTDEYAGFE
jgi:hypothetical protein